MNVKANINRSILFISTEVNHNHSTHTDTSIFLRVIQIYIYIYIYTIDFDSDEKLTTEECTDYIEDRRG